MLTLMTAVTLSLASQDFPGLVPHLLNTQQHVFADRCNQHAQCGQCVMSTSSNTSRTGHSDNCQWCTSLRKCVTPGDGASVPGCGAAQCIRSPDGGGDSNCDTTAGWPGVVCKGFVPPPPPPPISPSIWDSKACSCVSRSCVGLPLRPFGARLNTCLNTCARVARVARVLRDRSLCLIIKPADGRCPAFFVMTGGLLQL